MLKILVTGGNGFLGRHVIEKLQTSIFEYQILSPKSNECDFRCPLETKSCFKAFKPEVVIHLAAKVGGIGFNAENPGKFIYENLIMGTNVIESSRVFGVKKFIMVGTVCSYPKHTEVPFKEKDLWNGYPEETNAPYGIAKKTLMEMVIAYHKQYGFNATNLIPVNMYGPHDNFNLKECHVIPAIIKKIKQSQNKNLYFTHLWGTGEASREFLYVEDCTEAIVQSVHIDCGPEPINIGTGKEIKIRDLANEIADIMNFQGDFVWEKDKPDGQPRRCLDVSRAKERLGFEAKTNLKEGLIKTINWCNKNDNCYNL